MNVGEIKAMYLKGTRIELIEMNDPYAPVPSGTKGTVEFVDDMGQIAMKWDNGRTLALIPEVDKFKIIKEVQTMKYVVICLHSTGSTSNECDIIGIKDTYEEAKELFDKELPDVISDAEEWDMEYDEDEIFNDYFEARGNDWHPSYYMKLYIQEVK